MQTSRSRKNIFCFKRTMAIWVVMVLLFSNCGLSVSTVRADDIDKALLTGSYRGGGLSGSGLNNSDIENIKLPRSLGYIREIHKQGNNKPVIIYLQDAHCNYSCQKSIEGIIDFFNKNYGVELAAVEGGAGDYDFSIFTSIPDLEVREKTADYFVREGRVTGVELFAINNPGDIIVKGLEDPELYEKNLNVYRDSIAYKDEAHKYIDMISHFFDNFKERIFSEDMKNFDKRKKEYEQNTKKLKEYILYLTDMSVKRSLETKQFPNLSKLLELLGQEKNIDFEQAQNEREEVIDILMEKLSPYEISELIKRSVDFQKSEEMHPLFYEFLFNKMITCGIKPDEFGMLLEYKRYIEEYDAMEKDVFFEEIFDVEDYLADNITGSEDEDALYYMSKELDILNKLFNVSLTRPQYDYLKKNFNAVSAKRYCDFIKKRAAWYKLNANINPDIEGLDVYKTKISNFYRYSFKRDEAFIANIGKYAADKKAMFVVTGGFHTENMKELLKRNGYSYMLITPQLKAESYNPYFTLLAGGLSPIETVLTEQTSLIALRSVFSDIGLKSDWKSMSKAVKVVAHMVMNRETDSNVLFELPDTRTYLKLTFTPDDDEGYKKIGNIMGRDLYAAAVNRQEGDRPIRIERKDIKIGKMEKLRGLLELEDLAAKRDIEVLRMEADKMLEVFRKDGKTVERELVFDPADGALAFREKVEQMVKKLPFKLSSGYLDEHLTRPIEGELFRFLLAEMLGNSFDAIQSYYDRRIYPKGPSNRFKARIAVSLSIDPQDRLVLKVTDNGIGKFAATTEMKRTAPDDMYYGGGGRGLRTIANTARNTGGFFEYSISEQPPETMESGRTEFTLGIPLRAFTMDQAVLENITEADIEELFFPGEETSLRADIADEERPEDVILEGGFSEYAETQNEVRHESVFSIRPDQRIRIIIEDNPDNKRIFWGATEGNQKRQFKSHIKKYASVITGHKGDIELEVSHSRKSTVNSIYYSLENGYTPIVFRLKDLGMITGDFRSLLVDKKVPCISLNLKEPISGKENSDKAVLDPFSAAHLALLAGSLREIQISGAEGQEEIIAALKQGIMRIKAAMELSAVKEFPKGLTALFDGAISILLPRITDLDISGNIERWYRALRNVESSV